MSTQSSLFPVVRFAHTQPQQTFRLLELPPELLHLLSSDNAPTFYLKSSNPSTTFAPLSSTITSPSKGAETGYVHLCTPTQTYQVRQVSTSNSLFVAQPTKLLHESFSTHRQNGEMDAVQEDEVAMSAKGALAAIGQVNSVLELKAVQLDVEALLKGVVPEWQWNDLIMLEIHKSVGRAMSKREIFDEIPAPDGQIEHVWRDLFAFELEGRGYVPGQEMLYQAWRQVMHKFNLDGGFRALIDMENFLEVALEDDLNDGERELLNQVRSAIWWSPSLRKPADIAMEQKEIGDLDQLMTTAWVGKLVLQHMMESGTAVDAELFMTEWRNLLPERWSTGLAFDVLDQRSYQIETKVDGMRIIRLLGEAHGNATNGGAKEKGAFENAAKDLKAGTGPAGKRKWHEKFKGSRNFKK